MPVYSPATEDTLKDNSCFTRIKKSLSSTVAIFDMVEMLLYPVSVSFSVTITVYKEKSKNVYDMRSGA